MTYENMSIEELQIEEGKYKYWPNPPADLLVARRAARDAILDMAEGLDSDGLVVVPREPSLMMLFLGDIYSDLIQPSSVADVSDIDYAQWRRNEIAIIWDVMIDASSLNHGETE